MYIHIIIATKNFTIAITIIGRYTLRNPLTNSELVVNGFTKCREVELYFKSFANIILHAED